jgi:outer membrane biosynthesis protein TonB
MHFVKPVYPKTARLAHIQGVVKLHLVFADDGSIAELQPVSGDPLLVDSAMKAVQQWRVSFGRVVGRPMEHEIALSLTFSIEDPPKPAYLHLTNGKVIRADEVREFTDGIEYAVGGRTHRIAPGSVTDINACARVAVHLTLNEGECIPSGGPSFNIRAIPLLPKESAPLAQAPQLHRIRVDESVQKAKLVHAISPLYPPLIGKCIDGTVVLHVIISINGTVSDARYVSGPLNLGDPAIKAVLQWQYAPTLVDGVAAEVDTTVSVVFPPPVKAEPTASNK